MSRLSTALSNRLIWLYLRIKIVMSTSLPSTQETQKCENDSHIQRYKYILAYMHAFIHKNKLPNIQSTTDNGEMILIHSGYFYSASLSKLLLRGAPDHSN